jgi:uncharacterized cofD-like protein
VADHLTAIVTVADDGGSSGRLRDELGVLPPGDLRMALAALTEDTEWGRTWSAVLQHRFHTDGPLDNHAVGNLLIAALWELLGDPVEGLDWVGKLLSARGRVLPMSTVPLTVEADVEAIEAGGGVWGQQPDLRTVVGQSNVAKAHGRIDHLRITPANPPAPPQAVAAIEEADWVTLGPGSWYSSVLVNLLSPEIRQALHHTKARRCVTLNLTSDEETVGLSAVGHLDALHEHAPDLRIDVVLADTLSLSDAEGTATVDATRQAAARLGARLVLRHIARSDDNTKHDSLRLGAAYNDVFQGIWANSR